MGQTIDGGNALDVVISGDFVFIADETEGLKIVDISDPSNPVKVGQVADGGSAQGVYVTGDYAFVADYSDGLEIFRAGYNGDDLTDFEEIHQYFTDPSDDDSDDDNLIDGDEVFTYLTDPLDVDSDSDGFSDYEEILNNTNPTDPNDYPVTPPPVTITLPLETTTVTESSGKVLISVLGISFAALFAVVVLFRKKTT